MSAGLGSSLSLLCYSSRSNATEEVGRTPAAVRRELVGEREGRPPPPQKSHGITRMRPLEDPVVDVYTELTEPAASTRIGLCASQRGPRMRFGVRAVFGEWSSAGASSAQPAGRFVESTTELKRYREAETRDAEPGRPFSTAYASSLGCSAGRLSGNRSDAFSTGMKATAIESRLPSRDVRCPRLL